MVVWCNALLHCVYKIAIVLCCMTIIDHVLCWPVYQLLQRFAFSLFEIAFFNFLLLDDATDTLRPRVFDGLLYYFAKALGIVKIILRVLAQFLADA